MKVYLDNAATTKVDEDVYQTMLPYFREKYGNPSSLHSYGQEAWKAVEQARLKVVNAINAQKAEEIIFTGTTTEADNLAILGVAEALRDEGNHLITSAIEHHAILDTFKFLEQNGFTVTYLGVDSNGLVDPQDLKEAIMPDATLVSIMYANNEVGTVQPISQLAQIAKETGVVFHTDAAAAKYLNLDVQGLGVDLMSLGPHKFYGPKGVGILYVKTGTAMRPVFRGGAHERGLRPGTENVPAIVGAGEATELLIKSQVRHAQRVEKLRNRLINGVLEGISEARLTGGFEKRVQDIASFVIKGVEGEALLLSLDREGIAASSGSACTTGELQPSHVLLAMGYKPEEAHGSLRFSLGKDTTEKDIDYVLKKLPGIVERLRDLAPKL